MRTIAIEEHFRSAALRDALDAGAVSFAEYPMVPPLFGLLDDVDERRLAELDAAGIDMQVLSHTPPGPEAFGSGPAVEIARAMNDELAEMVRARPERYSGFAMLPTPAPDAAAEELARAVTQLGLCGAMVHGTTDGRFLDHPDFRPLWDVAAQLRVPVYLHPGVPPRAVRDAYYAHCAPEVASALATTAWGWHVETGLHALRLVLSGTFDRHPELQVIVGHMGEALPFMLARADAVLDGHCHLDRPLHEYFTQNLHYTTSGFFDDAPWQCLTAAVGIDRVLFAVDYPFGDNRRARAFLDTIQATDSERAAIAHRNAEALLRL